MVLVSELNIPRTCSDYMTKCIECNIQCNQTQSTLQDIPDINTRCYIQMIKLPIPRLIIWMLYRVFISITLSLLRQIFVNPSLQWLCRKFHGVSNHRDLPVPGVTKFPSPHARKDVYFRNENAVLFNIGFCDLAIFYSNAWLSIRCKL